MKNGLKNSEIEDYKNVGQIIEEVRVAMVTTIDADGKLHSRPMYAQEIDEQGNLWFFTSEESQMVQQVKREPCVNVTFADADDNEFVSAQAQGEITTDRVKMEELWSDSLKVWYKQGLDTPGICLLKLNLEEVEYWDSPGSAAVKFLGFIKAMAGGDAKDLGRHGKVEFH